MNKAAFIPAVTVLASAPVVMASSEGDSISGAVAFSTPIAAVYLMVLIAAIAGTAIYVGRR